MDKTPEQLRKDRAEAIEKAQVARGISDKELAARAGISRTTLWGIKNGNVKRPRQTTLEAIARTLALPVEQAEELRRREQHAWEAVVRAVDVGRSRVGSGAMTPGMALHAVAVAMTIGGPYELLGDVDYAFGLRPHEEKPEAGTERK